MNDGLQLRVGFAVKLEHDSQDGESVGSALPVGDGVTQVVPVLGVVVDEVKLERIGDLIEGFKATKNILSLKTLTAS